MLLADYLICLVLICFLIWATRTIITAFGIGEPLVSLAYVAIVLLVILWLIGYIPVPHIFHSARVGA